MRQNETVSPADVRILMKDGKTIFQVCAPVSHSYSEHQWLDVDGVTVGAIEMDRHGRIFFKASIQPRVVFVDPATGEDQSKSA